MARSRSKSLLDELVFKGGTSLRKLYAGNAGRFSLDLDFSVREIGADTETVLDLLTEHVKGRETRVLRRPCPIGLSPCSRPGSVSPDIGVPT